LHKTTDFDISDDPSEPFFGEPELPQTVRLLH